MALNRKLPPKKRIIAELDESQLAHASKHVKVDGEAEQPAVIATSIPATTVVNEGIFKRPLTVAKKQKHPLRAALETHFQNMNPATRGQFHYSEILRLIADYHCAKKHTFSKTQLDMFATTLFLYEKSCILEPLSKVAKQNCDSYKQILQPKFNALVFVEGNIRNSRYVSERFNLGHEKFFWLSIDKYIERLQINYGDNSAQEFAELCTHLKLEGSVVRMRNKHMTPEQRTTAINAFNSSIATLAEVVMKNNTTSLPSNSF